MPPYRCGGQGYVSADYTRVPRLSLVPHVVNVGIFPHTAAIICRI